MLALAALVVLAAPPPTTVNGDVIGMAEDFATRGPARVCMRDLAIEPRSGETVYLSYAGIHNGGVRLVVGAGEALFSMSESYAARRPKGRVIRRGADWRVYERTANNGRKLYVWGRPAKEADGELKLAIEIAGSLLDSKNGTELVLDRATFKRDPSKACSRTYAFGWDVILGNEAMDQK